MWLCDSELINLLIHISGGKCKLSQFFPDSNVFHVLCNLAKLLHLFYLRKRLFAGGPPANKFLFAGGPPANNFLFAGGPPANNFLFAGGPLATNLFLFKMFEYAA